MKNLSTLLIGILMLFCIPTTSIAQNDTISPVVLDFHIEFTDDALTDSIGAVFTVTYSEAIELVDSFSIVTHYYNESIWETYDQYIEAEALVEGNVLTVTPNRSFWKSYRYEFVVTFGSVKDLEGNSADSFYRTFIADQDAPEVVDMSIELTEDVTNDSVSAVFTLIYSENVKLNDNFTFVTHVFENGVRPEYDRYEESEITVNGNVITIIPERMFSMVQWYEFVVAFGSVTDLAGNWATSYTRIFTPDDSPPEVVGFETTITDSEFTDSVNVSFVLTYDEDVKLAGSYKFITYHRNAGAWEEYEQLSDTSILVSGNTLSLNPLRLYSSSDTYELVITAGSVKDLVDNIVTSFTEIFLVDTIRPKLIDISPNLSQPVATDAIFTFTFDESIRLANNFGFYTYHWNNDSAKYIEYEQLNASQVTVENKVVTFDPSLDFMPGQLVQIVLNSGSVLDMEGNRFQNVTGGDTLNYVSERFWTAEGGVTFVTFLPHNGDSLLEIPGELTISFSEAITLTDTSAVNDTSLDSLVYLRSNGTDLDYQASYDAMANTITISPSAELLWGSSYTFGFLDGFLNEAYDSIPAGEATFTIQNSTVVVDDYTIAEINGEGTVSPEPDQVVRITGTITGIYPNEGFFVQDAAERNSGIWVEYANTTEYIVGDGVVVTGTVDTLQGVTAFIAEEVTTADSPLTIEPLVYTFGTDSLPMYQNVLVQIANVRASESDVNGEWVIYANGDADSVVVNSRMFEFSPANNGNYNVTGIVTGWDNIYHIEPRIEADIVVVTDPTSVNLSPTVGFNVYPNPFENVLRISNNDKLTRVIISNITGQRVVDVSYPKAEIYTSHLVSGVYIISMFNENKVVKTSRIIKH